MYNFIAISGWILTVISTVIAIIQYKQVKKYKKLYQTIKQQTINGNGTGYQAETMTVNNGTNN